MLNLIIYSTAHIFGDLLYSLSVRNLFIKDVPLNEIGKDLFLGVGKSIREIQLRNTKLNSIPSDSLTVIIHSFYQSD